MIRTEPSLQKLQNTNKRETGLSPYRRHMLRKLGGAKCRLGGREASARSRYNHDVARGWESKSVEAQIEEAGGRVPHPQAKLSRHEVAQLHLKENLTLSRKQVLQQLKVSEDPRRRAMLESALADLDARLAALGA